MDACSEFKGKRITVVGLGLLGRGVGDTRYLASCGADLVVTDLKTEEDLHDSLTQLSEFPNIEYSLGEHRLEDFQDRDLIINGPAVPLNSPYIQAARDAGIRVTMSTALFARIAREAGATIVGITGTRGKTTVTEMIAHVLTIAGKNALVGGNIRGVSTLALLPQVQEDTIAVLELDSWQLQGFRDEGISPQVAVFTTFYPDHLNYYKTMEPYLADKAAIFLNQGPEDVLVLGKQAEPIVRAAYDGSIKGHIVVPEELPETSIPGQHNRENAAAALEAVRALGVPDSVSLPALASFKGVAGRLELVREVKGVKFYNDTNATTPEATLAALRALGPRTLLIMGGADKGLSLDMLAVELPSLVKDIFFLEGTGTDRMRSFVPNALSYGSVEEAVREAYAAAEEGDSVLLSPAFASFGMFKNEYERGDAFNAAVAAL